MGATVTDFVGRETELLHLAKLFSNARLVTVIGPGGVGKTSVSLRAVAEATGDYSDGVWIVELSGLRDPELLPNTVASRLGLPEQDARQQVDAVLDHLRDRQMLLMLDTCEHLIDACAGLIEAILREAPRVTLLATSRQPLDVSGEHTFAVNPLPPQDAVELFARRARGAKPDFQVTDATRPAVAGICQRLDGIPLAIELAAVQLRRYSLRDLASRLDSHFAMNAEAEGGTIPRHQTIRRAIEWSYDLCSPVERALWQRLSVFAGWVDLEAIEEVCAESDPERAEILAALIGLVDKSVVLREPLSDDRYRLLDTIREFGAEQLATSADEVRWRGRHFDRYLRLAEGFRDNFASDEQMERYQALHEEHANIQAALVYTLDSPDGDGDLVQSGASLVSALAMYWMISGLLREGGYWLGKALARFPGRGPERGTALVTRGLLRSFQGDVTGSIADCREAISIAEEIGDPWISARGYLHMNLSLTFTGDHEQSALVGEEARRRLTANGDRMGLLMLFTQMGHLHQLAGRLDEAVATCNEGLALLGEGSAERWLQSYLLIVSSFALFQIPGREADCAAYATQALCTKSELGDIAGTAYALETLGWLATRAGRLARCAWLLGAADPLWSRVGSRFGGTALLEEVHQQCIGAASAALGASRFQQLWDLGASLPVANVVSYAVADADELPEGTSP
ncbi:MAG TPA: NB-ARC domain-containing protein [Trebonia sp.]